MFDIVGVLILVILWLVFAFLVRGSRHARNAILKWIGVIVAGLFTVVLTLVIIVVLFGFYRLNSAPAAQASAIKVQGTPEQLARGQKIANLCVGCHSISNTLPLNGAAASFLEGTPIGVIQPPNLTPAGPLKDWSDGEIIRAIRDGIDKSGRPQLIMPSDQFHNMSDADVQSVVAFLRSQPAAAHATEPTQLSVLGALIIGIGGFPTSAQTPTTGPVAGPPPGATAEYGQYVVTLAGCRSCHGSDLGGGQISPFGGPPVGPNLTAIVAKMSDAEFVSTIRTGIDPSGHHLDPDMMPYSSFAGAFDDSELKGVYSYLKSVPPVNRAVPGQ